MKRDEEDTVGGGAGGGGGGERGHGLCRGIAECVLKAPIRERMKQ
jgi:hypothetical protein